MPEPYKPVLNLGTFLGHGLADNGRVYEGDNIDNKPRFFYADNGEEIKESAE